MKTVWKTPLDWPADGTTVQLPKGAELLTVQMQGPTLCLWALVDPQAPLVPFQIRTAGTGHPLTDEATRATYLGTFQLAAGQLIFHAFGWEA